MLYNKNFGFTEIDVKQTTDINDLALMHQQQTLVIDELLAKIESCKLDLSLEDSYMNKQRKTKLDRALASQKMLLSVIEKRMGVVKNGLDDVVPFDDANWWFDNLTDIGLPNKKINTLIDSYLQAKSNHGGAVAV